MVVERECPKSGGCPLYSRFRSKELLEIWKNRFCNHPARHLDCARYRLGRKGEDVPVDLLPSGDRLHEG